MLALVAAMRQELAGIRRGMVVEETASNDGFDLFRGRYRGKPVLLARSGMGRERAEKAARLILERYPVTGLVSLGFGGGLTPESKVGDIVICSVVCCGNEDHAAPCQSDTKLESLCPEATGIKHGKSVTVELPVETPGAKLTLGQSSRADVVDMESYWIAKIAASRRIPFLGVRVISDAVQDRLPSFDIFKTDGRIRWERAVPYVLSNPNMVKLLGLQRNTRRSAKSLTAFVDSLLMST